MMNIKRWIPLAIVGAAAGCLVYLSNENISMEGEATPPQIDIPPQGTDYRLPNNFRNVFHIRKKADVEAAGTALANDSAGASVQNSTQTAGAAKGPGGKAAGPKQPVQKDVILQGIIWDPVSPIVSINGKLMKQGEKRDGIKVIKIFRDSALLDVNGKLVKKMVR